MPCASRSATGLPCPPLLSTTLAVILPSSCRHVSVTRIAGLTSNRSRRRLRRRDHLRAALARRPRRTNTRAGWQSLARSRLGNYPRPVVGWVMSKQRVADHGEVFTPSGLVDAMLDLVE